MKNLNVYLTPDLRHAIKQYMPHFIIALVAIAYTAWSHHCFHQEVMKVRQEMIDNYGTHRETARRIDSVHGRLDYLWHMLTHK